MLITTKGLQCDATQLKISDVTLKILTERYLAVQQVYNVIRYNFYIHTYTCTSTSNSSLFRAIAVIDGRVITLSEVAL